MITPRRLFLAQILLAPLLALILATQADALPKGFVYLNDSAPDVVIELRYFTNDNFLGKPVDGYEAQRCIITEQAAEALVKVQSDLKPFGLGLKVFDAYRPQRAVDHFVRWAKDLQDVKMKSAYYPHVEKKDLFTDGYIFGRSGHSRGSTVDLTIVALDENGKAQELDMGTGFDFFGPQSWPEDSTMTGQQRANRMLLRLVMEKHGFQPYEKEWWHFTLRHEPYPETYFDFPVE